MEWLGTNTGNVINLSDPDPNQITIEDIASGLANICRFNGQLHTWYSVAEHSLNVESLVPYKYKLQALLHDASEAFICDIPTPLKRQLGESYMEVERKLQRAIGNTFHVTLDELPALVKQADRIMTVSERDAFTSVPLPWHVSYEESVRYPALQRRYDNPAQARRAFLQRFAELTVY